MSAFTISSCSKNNSTEVEKKQITSKSKEIDEQLEPVPSPAPAPVLAPPQVSQKEEIDSLVQEKSELLATPAAIDLASSYGSALSAIINSTEVADRQQAVKLWHATQTCLAINAQPKVVASLMKDMQRAILNTSSKQEIYSLAISEVKNPFSKAAVACNFVKENK